MAVGLFHLGHRHTSERVDLDHVERHDVIQKAAHRLRPVARRGRSFTVEDRLHGCAVHQGDPLVAVVGAEALQFRTPHALSTFGESLERS